MRSTALIRAAKLGYILLSAVFCALGLWMIVQPDSSAALLSRLTGILLVAFGIVKMVGYYSRDLYRLAFQHDLAMGILSILMGLLIALRPGWALNLLCLLLGIEIIADGLFKLQTSLDARRFGLNTWWLMLAFAIVAGGVGVALVVAPEESGPALVQLLGASLMAEGVLNLCVALCAVKIIAHQTDN